MQIDRKEFKELLKEIQKYNKIDLLAQGFQTKYAREAVGVDDEQRRKDAIKTNELLESILLALSGAKDKAGAKVVSIKAAKKAREDEDKPRSLQDVRNLIKEDLLKFKEELKTGVAFGKKVGGGIADAVRNPLETMKKVGSGIADFGKSAFGQAKDVLSTPSSYKNPMIAALQRPSAAAVDNPNIVDSPAEKVAEENEKQSASIKELLDVTKESLDQLKAIRGSLEGAPATRSAQPASKTPPAPVAPAPAAAEEGGSVIGDIAGAATSGIGGKIMGGIKAGGAMLGKGALAAGKMIGGAALAKPALIAGGVALAGYAAYKGYKALTGGSEGAAAGADPELEKAKESKQAKQLQQLASEGKYTFSGEGRNVNVFNKETGELVQSIQAPDRISGKELIQVAGVGGGLGAKAESPKGQEISSAEAKMLSRREEQGRLKPGDKEKLAAFRGEKNVGSDSAPVSSKGGYGDKIGSFFGGIKDSVVGAAGTVGAAVGGVASGIRDKISGTAQYLKDEYNRDLSGRVGETMSEQMVTTKSSMTDSDQTDKSGTLEKRDMQGGITAQKSLFGSTFLGSLFSKKGQTTGQFSSDQSKDERFTGDAAALGLGSDLGVDYEKRKSSSLLGERISSGSLFKRDKYKVTDTETGQELNMSKSEYNKMQALVKEGKAEEAQKLFDEINAREAAYVPEAGITPEEQMVAPSPGSSNLAAVKDMKQNAELRDQMAATSKTSTPVVSNNVQTNNTTAFMPAKADPRPTHKGSALERYNERIGVY